MDDKRIFSVSEINSYIRGLLETDSILSHITVAGEISNFTHHRSGHIYFTLKDERSSLRSAFFKGNNLRCKFLPSDGMNVWGIGRISVYEPSGQYQLIIDELEPAGMGSLYMAFEQLKKRLEREGLFQRRHKKPLPAYPRSVGLVTSPTGAALQDILSTAGNRFAPVQFLLVETLVQGTKAPADIVASIRRLNRLGSVDVIILARGGGSLEDLWAFNTEEVARAIFASAVPVVSAIGHETDFTISDFVADHRAPTPTGAASLLFPKREDLRWQISSLNDRLSAGLRRRVERERQRLEYVISERFYRLPYEYIGRKDEQRRELSSRLEQSFLYQLQEKAYRLANSTTRLEGLSPLKIMQRGYSFCRDEDGRLVRSVADVREGERLELAFLDGKAWARIEKIIKGESP